MVQFSKYSNQPHRFRANYINGELVDWINIPNKGWVAVGYSSGKVYNWDDNTGKVYHISPTTYDLQQIANSNSNSKAAFNKRYANAIRQAKARSWKPKVTQSENPTTDSDTSDKPVDPNNGAGDTDRGGGNPRGGNHPRGTGGSGTQTPPQTPTYNYNFGQYYTADPNDSSKRTAHNYFNADTYSSRRAAFNAARDAGYGVFTWRGKAYNTMKRGENADTFRQNHTDYDTFITNAHKGIQDGIDNSGGWSNDPHYKQESPTQTSNPSPTQTSTQTNTPQQQQFGPSALGAFRMSDITDLGFNNYSGMLSAINNQANARNPFIIAMKDRYGSDTSKWDQNKIENDLRIKGKYRGRLLGDFKDMYNNMSNWTFDRNDRTGSNGIIYSSKEMRDAYENHNPNRQQSTQTSTAGTTNTSATTGTTNTTPSNTSYTPNKYSWQSNTKNNTSQFNTDLSPYLNMGYAMQHQQHQQHQKLQKGGTINMEEQQLQQAFLQYLMQKTGAKDQQQLEQVIQQLGEDGLKQAYSQFLQEIQQQQVQAAKFGAKLNYIRHLNGQCPDGTEMTYFKVGGKLCKKCMQRQQKEQETEEPSDPIKAFKCGRKMKRK